MQYDRILVRFGEISTKGRNRNRFIDKLSKNIRQQLSAYPGIMIEKTRDRIFIKLNGEPHNEITAILTNVFGINSFSLAVKTKSDLDMIKDAALVAFKDLDYKGKTFKVTVKRADKQFPLETNELNYEIGSYVLKNTKDVTVDVHKPDINVRVEIRKEATYITCMDIQGAGGLPVGTNGRAMLMLSGGLDSPVAAYLGMKRGLEIEAVHFYSPPYTSERSKQKVIDLVKKLTTFSPSIKLHIVPFTEIQEVIQKQVPDNYSLISTRRMMLKITDALRNKQNALAIATGESLGQVASQTLESMYAINDVTSTPVIRPVVAMDKLEIIDIAKEIDTYDISIRPFEDCCTIFTPSAPKTRPKKEKVSYYESFVDFEELIHKAVDNIDTIEVNAKSTSNTEVDDLF